MLKKVLIIITKSNFGGAQRYVYDLATNLPKDTFSVTVALGGTGERNATPGILKAKLEEKGIQVREVHHFMRDMSLREDVLAFFDILRLIRQERPDVLHVTSSKAGGLGTLAGRLARVRRIIFTSHGLAYDEAWRSPLQRILIRIMSWCTFSLATKTIQLTMDTYTRASSLPFMKHKMALVHNGREQPVFLSREEARAVLYSDETTSRAQWIGAIAELTRNKNLEVLLDALKLVHDKGPHPHLVLIGEGEERHSLQAQVTRLGLEPFVHFTGYVENASQYLRAFDVFTLPSRKEGLPYVLLEAGYASLPVVVSNLPGLRDIVTEKTGIMLEPTPENLALAFTELLEDEGKRMQYGNTLYEHVLTMFSIKKMVEDTVRVYLG